MASPYPNVLVAASTSGPVVGGYRTLSCQPDEWLYDPKSFVFSLTDDAVYYNTNPTSQVSIFCPAADLLELWTGALSLNQNGTDCIGHYSPLPSEPYYADLGLGNSTFGINTVEAYKVTFL